MSFEDIFNGLPGGGLPPPDAGFLPRDGAFDLSDMERQGYLADQVREGVVQGEIDINELEWVEWGGFWRRKEITLKVNWPKEGF